MNNFNEISNKIETTLIKASEYVLEKLSKIVVSKQAGELMVGSHPISTLQSTFMRSGRLINQFMDTTNIMLRDVLTSQMDNGEKILLVKKIQFQLHNFNDVLASQLPHLANLFSTNVNNFVTTLFESLPENPVKLNISVNEIIEEVRINVNIIEVGEKINTSSNTTIKEKLASAILSRPVLTTLIIGCGAIGCYFWKTGKVPLAHKSPSIVNIPGSEMVSQEQVKVLKEIFENSLKSMATEIHNLQNTHNEQNKIIADLMLANKKQQNLVNCMVFVICGALIILSVSAYRYFKQQNKNENLLN